MPRITGFLATIVVVGLLASCASHEGNYSPACAAFAGDRIELLQGKFTWEKFTDSVVVDADGDVINQFPGYPMSGSYRIDGPRVSMESGSGEVQADMYLLQQEGRRYLLTGEQYEAWGRDGRLAECALVRGEKQNY